MTKKLSYFRAISICLFLLLGPSSIHAEPLKTQKEVKTLPLIEKGNIPEGLLQMGDSSYYPRYAFILNKKKKALGIWQLKDNKFQQIAHFPADFGKGVGDKLVLGDLKTPEGVYFMTHKYDGPNLLYEKYGSHAFDTTYPNYFDQRDGKSGSGIWLHAIPDTISLERGSRGCVVVRDKVIKNISQYINLQKTPIIIFDEVMYSKTDHWQKKRQEALGFLHQWKKSWKNKAHQQYINFYHTNFEALKMNKSKWKNYKTKIANEYSHLNIELSEPLVINHRNQMTVRFLQKYTSDKYSDFGEKTLFIKKEQGQFKIYGEQWKRIDNPEIWATVKIFNFPQQLSAHKNGDNTKKK